MEEEKAAAYYEELTRKGEGAARFKQGLGFSNSPSNDDVPKPGSALASSSSSFLSKFVKASSPSKASESEKLAQLQSIQNKLKKNPASESRVSERSIIERESDTSRRRSRSRERYRDRGKESRRRSRSRSRDGDRYRNRDRDRRRRRRRSRSESDSDGERRRRERDRGRRRSRSVSPRRSEKNRSDRGNVSEAGKGKNAVVDYAKLIDGYDNMVCSCLLIMIYE